MPLVVVKFPEERWRKVNVSRFLSRFKTIPVSKIVDVPEEELDRVLEVLRRNGCEVEVVEPVRDDIEVKILKEILRRVEAIRLGLAEPKELEKVAVEAISKFSMANLSDEVSEILHDCIDFAENPTISDLNDIESRARDALGKRLSLHAEPSK